MFNLGSASWTKFRDKFIRVSDQLDQINEIMDQRDIDPQVVIVDQFTTAMAPIQEAITGLGKRIDGQYAQEVPIQGSMWYDPTIP